MSGPAMSNLSRLILKNHGNYYQKLFAEKQKSFITLKKVQTEEKYNL